MLADVLAELPTPLPPCPPHIALEVGQ